MENKGPCGVWIRVGEAGGSGGRKKWLWSMVVKLVLIPCLIPVLVIGAC